MQRPSVVNSMHSRSGDGWTPGKKLKSEPLWASTRRGIADQRLRSGCPLNSGVIKLGGGEGKGQK